LIDNRYQGSGAAAIDLVKRAVETINYLALNMNQRCKERPTRHPVMHLGPRAETILGTIASALSKHSMGGHRESNSCECNYLSTPIFLCEHNGLLGSLTLFNHFPFPQRNCGTPFSLLTQPDFYATRCEIEPPVAMPDSPSINDRLV